MYIFDVYNYEVQVQVPDSRLYTISVDNSIYFYHADNNLYI